MLEDMKREAPTIPFEPHLGLRSETWKSRECQLLPPLDAVVPSGGTVRRRVGSCGRKHLRLTGSGLQARRAPPDLCCSDFGQTFLQGHTEWDLGSFPLS